MTAFARFLGLARSIAIYHAIPFRQRRLRRLYTAFVRPGDLVFDVGGHVGNRTRAFLALGCRVVTLEPQPAFAALLRRLFSGNARVTVIEAGLGRVAGTATLSVSDRYPTVTTMNHEWRRARAHEPGFDGVAWNRHVEIAVTTLDDLVARFGEPAFVKIDVEGAEASVLAGVSRPLRALSFEYLPEALAEARTCISRLTRLDRYEFNYAVGEEGRLALQDWTSAEGILRALETPDAQRRPGDVYARRVRRNGRPAETQVPAPGTS